MALAEGSGLTAASADLVIITQVTHWPDLPCLYEEAWYVARMDVILVLVTYDVLHADSPMEPLA